MKGRFQMKHIISILMCLFFCISCGSPVSTDKQGLTIENNKTNPGGVIKAKIVSDENIKSISVGINNVLTINTTKPEGKKWEGEADIPVLNPGKYEIAFVVTPFDAPSTTLTSEIEVVNKPTFDVQTSSVDGKQIITVNGLGITLVELLENDATGAKKVSFTKNNNTFEYHGSPQPSSKLVITDSNGLTQEKSLSFETQNAIFFGALSPKHEIGNPSIFMIQTENQTKSTQEERLIPYEQQDDYMDSILSNSTSKKNEPSAFVWVLGISPNRRFMFLSSVYTLEMKKPTIDSGRKLYTASLRFYYIYDRETKTNHLIDKMYRKVYHAIPKEGTILKEIGSYYYPVFWGQDELLVIKVKKGENFVLGSDIEKYPQLKTANQEVINQSLDATSKCMSISLKDFTLKDSDKVKPITPWVCWADQYKGIISWTSISEPQASAYAILPNPEMGTPYPNFVSDLSGDHVWNLPAQAKTVLTKDEKYEETQIISAVYWKGKKSILIVVSSNKNIRECVIDIETGTIEVLTVNIYKGLDFNYGYRILSGTLSNPNQEPLALLRVTPEPINPHRGGPPYKKDVYGFYIAQITKDDIKLLWKVYIEEDQIRHRNPFFMTEVSK